MEIKILNVSIIENKKKVTNNLNLLIKNSKITGIYNDTTRIIPNLLTNKLAYEGTILIDNQPLKKYQSNLITYLTNDLNFLTKTVSDEFFLISHKGQYTTEEYLKKTTASLKLFNLSEEILIEQINNLSKSSKKLIKYATNFTINPDIFIIEEPYIYLDKNNINNLKNIILELKKKYQKTIIILSNDINILYELCDDLIIFSNNQLLIQDTSKKVFNDIPFLEKNEIELPDLIKFKVIANQYNKTIANHKDIKDLIKEVYKNV